VRRARGEGGFTLIEVLTVVVILGVLAAIAIPVFLAQRGRAADTATKRDLSTVAKAAVARMIETGTAPTVAIVGGQYQVDGEEVGPVSHGVQIGGANPALADSTGWTLQAWCLTLNNPSGTTGDYRFSAQQGLEPGSCSSATAP
jgi:type IV pilus assembly protein PilA